jgi:hypothetical protein
MSVVNKLEITYLEILRIVVLVIATILLVVTIVAGFGGLGGMSILDSKNISPDKVTLDEVIKELAPHQSVPGSPNDNSNSSSKAPPDDPYNLRYEKIAGFIDVFVNSYSGGAESVEKEKVVSYLASLADKYDVADMKTTYVDGLTDTVDKALKSEVVIARVKKSPAEIAKETNRQMEASLATSGIPGQTESPPNISAPSPIKESPIQVSIEVVDKFTTIFNKKIAAAEALTAKVEVERLANRAASMTKLYIAGGAFMTFLMVVFVSILVKIERNLRVVAERP